MAVVCLLIGTVFGSGIAVVVTLFFKDIKKSAAGFARKWVQEEIRVSGWNVSPGMLQTHKDRDEGQHSDINARIDNIENCVYDYKKEHAAIAERCREIEVEMCKLQDQIRRGQE